MIEIWKSCGNGEGDYLSSDKSVVEFSLIWEIEEL